ncbi:multicopper oxidase-domain-containing protein [Xylariales sp. PMI_506]|nr:multicopper oxidase-domain-containing protein [Xylariales sp. PMI_506]
MVLFDLWLVFQPDTTTSAASSAPAKQTTTLDEFQQLSINRPDADYILDPVWDFNAPSQIRYYNWTILDKEANPDGVYKPMMTINGQFPGPLIEVNEGDTIVVDVQNLAVNATAIHWHGIFQNGTAWMDGTAGVTQCPISPGKSFQYKFTVQGQSGTYFYHGHQGVQSLEGLVGPLVVHGRNETRNQQLPYETDRVVLLQDWYYDSAAGLMVEKLSPGSEDSPNPNAALINGLNPVDCSLHPHRRCDTKSAFATMNLTPGANHRLRFINLGSYAWFQVTVDEHMSLPIVEVDGTAVEPAPESDIMIAPGQRYSVVITANQTSLESYWLRARMIKACFSPPKIPENGSVLATAIIRYSSSSNVTETQSPLPSSTDTNKYTPNLCKDMTARSKYHPSPAVDVPAYADHSWYVRTNLAIGHWRLQRGVMNASSFRPDLKEPTLLRLVDGLAAGNASFAALGVNKAAFDVGTELVVSHAGIETVDVVIQNMDENSHPFHLHGNQFWVMGAGHGYFPGYEKMGLKPEGKGLLEGGADAAVLRNPLKRDVATAEGFGWLWVRFVADNPGVWILHCHMIWHSESGMAMQFISRLDDIRGWTVPENVRALCAAPEEELRKGAPPPDEVFFGFHNGRGDPAEGR